MYCICLHLDHQYGYGLMLFDPFKRTMDGRENRLCIFNMAILVQ